jgi:DNA-binding NarL/FixJ family response regulator
VVHTDSMVGVAHVSTHGSFEQPSEIMKKIRGSGATEQSWVGDPAYSPDDAADRVHGEPQARAAGILRQAHDKATRATPQDVIAIWQAVIAGEWSLVAHFDDDAQRCFLARRNDPGALSGSRLSERERQIVAYASLGHSNKLIAYELGLCSSTVAAQLTSAARKLGVSSRKTLLHVAAVLGSSALTPGRLDRLAGECESPAEGRAEEPAVLMTWVQHDGQDFAVIQLALAPKLPPSLSAAERDVAKLAIEGLSNAAIAARRSTSVRTVANQLRSIYTKLAVGSRRQLCSRFSIQRDAGAGGMLDSRAGERVGP